MSELLEIQNNKVYIYIYILAVFYYEMCVYPHVKQFLPAQELMSTSKLWYTFLVSGHPRIDGTVPFNITVNYITGEVQLVLGVEIDNHQLYSTLEVKRINHFFLIRHQSTYLCKVLSDVRQV